MMNVAQEVNAVDIECISLKEDLVQAELSVTLSKEMIDGLIGISGKHSNQGKKLIIYNDKSGSMSGRPYQAVLAASKSLADLVFADDTSTDENVFESVRTVFYHSKCMPTEANTKMAYLQRIKKEDDNRFGGTSFSACFQDINKVVKSMKNGSEVFILFNSDGQDSRNGLGQLQSFLKDQEKSRNIQSTVYCLGLSKYHDAAFLNEIAKSGSNQGNFIYIDTTKHNFEQELTEALQSSLGMAVSMAQSKKFHIAGKVESTKEVYFNQDGDIVSGKDDWTSMQISCSVLAKSKDFTRDSIIGLQLSKDVLQLTVRNFSTKAASELPVDKRLSLEINVINQEVFDLIEKIQSKIQRDEKESALKKLDEINASLNDKYVDCMGVKGNKIAKKALMTSIQECRERLSKVISELRNVQDLSNLSNTAVANLYDAAYKGINKGGLRKMIDKRALQNEAMYQKIEQELAEIVAKQDFDKLLNQNKEIIEDVGDCAFSVMNSLEAMQDSDCMCISLSVDRPESAIADPTKLIVKDVFPTYITADSFLQSA